MEKKLFTINQLIGSSVGRVVKSDVGGREFQPWMGYIIFPPRVLKRPRFESRLAEVGDIANVSKRFSILTFFCSSEVTLQFTEFMQNHTAV